MLGFNYTAECSSQLRKIKKLYDFCFNSRQAEVSLLCLFKDFPVGSELQTRIQNTAESSSLNESDHTSSPMGVRFSTGTRRTNIASTNVGTVDDNLADEEPNDDALETTRLEPCGIVLAR